MTAKTLDKVSKIEGIEKTKQYLVNLFKARFPFIYIPTWEEIRIIDLITEIAGETEKIKTARDIFIWSSTEGLKRSFEQGQKDVDIQSNNPNYQDAERAIGALKFIEEYENPAILILKDVHPFLGAGGRVPNSNFIRKIRDVAGIIKNAPVAKNIVIITPTLTLPIELQKDMTVVDFDLPTLNEIKELLEDMIDKNSKFEVSLDEKEKEQLCKGAQGLTLQEAENAFARAMVTNGRMTIDELDIILEEKCQVIKKTGILEFIPTTTNIKDVGGLENLKKWLEKRNNSWLGKAQTDYNLPSPKGVLITGVPGCGKSLTAKAMAGMWHLPLLRLDVGKIFSGLIGSSEENMRKAIQTAEAVAPCILWVDEIEKGFGSQKGELDGGTSSRVFGTFLTWMNEKTKPVFVIATANNIDKLPAEMLRKGRFDEIFFVDLPTFKERKEIFKLHLEKRLKDSISSDFEITDKLLFSLAEKTEGFGGSEIEQSVVAALFEAFYENRELKEEDLIKVIEHFVPLSSQMLEQIIKIRTWANERAISASAHDDDYDYEPGSMPDVVEKIAKTQKQTEIINKTRGGRTIDF